MTLIRIVLHCPKMLACAKPARESFISLKRAATKVQFLESKRGSVLVARAQAGEPRKEPPTPQQMAEKDKLINLLVDCKNPDEFNRSVADNIMSIDEHFWLRLATRNDAADEEEKQKLSSLATTVMHLVEAAVAKTEEQLTGSGKIVQKIMAAGANADGTWVIPLPDENAEAMKQALEEHRDDLGEPFLASCFAYLEKASKDQLDEIVFLIQRILQMYAARQWSQVDADGQHDALLQDVLTSDPQNWENMIHDMATSGELPETAFMASLQQKMEQTVLSMKSGSYSQRVQAEYLKEVEARAKTVYKQLSAS